MKKKYIAVTLAATMAFGIFAACSDKSNQNYTPTAAEDSIPLVLGIEGADGVYNPFFATAAYDSEIAGQTQIGMLTTSPDGEIVWGDDQACVVKDCTTTYLNAQGVAIPESQASNAATTRYEFLIKKGIKFSDGVDLTIKDVLFNLYVYLDPAYTGSSTIYSTDIVGLEDYRTQGSGDEANMNKLAEQNADARLNRITQYLDNLWLEKNGGSDSTGAHKYTPLTADKVAETEADIIYFLQNYGSELDTAYTSAVSGFDESRKTYMFQPGQYWQYYLYNYGLVQYEKTANNRPKKVRVKFENNDFVNGDYIYVDQEEYPNEDISQGIYEVYEIKFDSSSSEAENNKQWADQAAQFNGDDDAIREWAEDLIYKTTVCAQPPASTDQMPDFQPTDLDHFKSTVLGSSTTNTLYNYILSSEKSKVIEFGGISSISGITTRKTSTFNGKDLGSEYDVLRITINKVDPKAIWNFGFTVAPRHYYAPEDEARAAAAQEKEGAHPYLEEFGVVYNSSIFMDQVLKKTERNRVPVGAGAYKASDSNGLDEGQLYPEAGEFEYNKRVYYERNEFFDTVDEQVGGGPIQNARIKYLQYQVVTTNTILQSLQSGTIDVGNPNCTTNNTEQINSINSSGGHLGQVKVMTNGYGYVGINAGMDAVSDIWIRRAIMMAMDINIINGKTVSGQYQPGYFGAGNSQAIYRPMSIVSWAYPENCTVYNPSTASDIDESQSANYVNSVERNVASDINYTYDPTGVKIHDMLVKHGYTDVGGKIRNKDGSELAAITFTVAGETSDHPAYQMFNNAKEILQKIGFTINVQTDNAALNKLTYGGLTVWAAAWSSTIDPDMYQVYHKDSKAGSTVNWGYSQMVGNIAKWPVENSIINELSNIIDRARETTIEAVRAQDYAQALNLVMELAVEMPAYQRYDLTVYNYQKIDPATLLQKPTAYAGPFAYIWEIGYNDSFTGKN